MPGVGLLLIRLVSGVGLIFQGILELRSQPSVGLTTLAVFAVGAGALQLVGLWTPIAGTLAAVIEASTAYFSLPHDPWTFILLGTFGIALALLGPGAWSIDARLFGWKRIELRDRQS